MAAGARSVLGSGGFQTRPRPADAASRFGQIVISLLLMRNT